MPFFFVLPLWVVAVVVGVVMACLPRTRRIGIYVATVSTFATISSFVLSTVVLLAGAQSGPDAPAWARFAIVGGYLVAIPIGGLLGAVVGSLVTRRVMARGSI